MIESVTGFCLLRVAGLPRFTPKRLIEILTIHAPFHQKLLLPPPLAIIYLTKYKLTIPYVIDNVNKKSLAKVSYGMQNRKVKVKIEEYQPVANRLKELRAHAGLSQKDMAAKIGCVPPSLADYELGKALPAPKVLQNLIEMGYDANWLLTGSGRMLLEDTPWQPHIDSDTLGAIVGAMWRALEEEGVQLTSEGAIEMATLAYEEYQRSEDDADLGLKVKRLARLIGQGRRK